MILKRRVSLGGVQLDSLDNRIIITGIDPAAGRENISATGNAAGNGQRITGRRRDTLDVTVKFTMNIKNNDMAAREELLEKILGWAAGGGWMRIGSRPGRKLLVTPAQLPGSGDMFNWASEFTMVFRAYSVPYWMDDEATETGGNVVSSGSFGLEVTGNTQSVADLKIENKSGMTINKITVSVGGNQMVFSDLNMGGNDVLTIDHAQTNEKFYFRAKMAGKSVLAKRTGANDFYVKPGANTVTFSADRAVKVTASVRGRYL
jgi:hypothetical protein